MFSDKFPIINLRKILITRAGLGEIMVISDRFSLGWLSGDHTPFPGVGVLMAFYCICIYICIWYPTKRTVTAGE